MTTKEEQSLAEHICDMLSSKQFERWNGEDGRFNGYVTGEEGCPTKDDILIDIKCMFIQPVIDKTSTPVVRMA
jgi:hypothetical protein